MKNKIIRSQSQNTSTQMPVEAAPTPGAPIPPKGFDSSKPAAGNVVPLQNAQLKLAGSMATEIDASSTLAADIGPHLGDQTSLVALLFLAASWSTERMHAEAWHDYARDREVKVWKPTLEALEVFQRSFDTAVAADPSIAEKYPQTAAFFGFRSRSAKLAGKTRKAKKAAQAAQPVASTPSTASSQPPAVTHTVTVTPAVPASPPPAGTEST